MEIQAYAPATMDSMGILVKTRNAATIVTKMESACQQEYAAAFQGFMGLCADLLNAQMIVDQEEAVTR